MPYPVREVDDDMETARLTIARQHGGHRPDRDPVRIRVQDGNGRVVVDVLCRPEDFTDALFGRGETHCEIMQFPHRLSDPEHHPDPNVMTLHEALRSLMMAAALSPHDWSMHHRLAWIWGILYGWTKDRLRELQVRFGWDDHTVSLLLFYRSVVAGVQGVQEVAGIEFVPFPGRESVSPEERNRIGPGALGEGAQPVDAESDAMTERQTWLMNRAISLHGDYDVPMSEARRQAKWQWPAGTGRFDRLSDGLLSVLWCHWTDLTIHPEDVKPVDSGDVAAFRKWLRENDGPVHGDHGEPHPDEGFLAEFRNQERNGAR